MSDSTQRKELQDHAGRMVGAIYGRAPAGSVPPVILPPPRAAAAIPPPRPPGRLLLAPEELERYGNLLVFARTMVEGYFAGKHKSPYRGSSVEFTDYREYVPGDDPKHIDWRAYGRSRRLFVRQYEAETDMVIYLMVDISGSMAYSGSERDSKYILAAKIAAALSYLMIHQGDKAALALFASGLKFYLPPGGTRRHLHNLVTQLEVIYPALGTSTADALAECDVLFRKRGRLVVLSDFWDRPEQIFEALSRFLHRKFEVLLLHMVHPDERDLPSAHAARFRDMETNEEVQVEPEEIRAAYSAAARQRMDALAREATYRGISYAPVNTARPYLEAIEAYLGFRGRNTLSQK